MREIVSNQEIDRDTRVKIRVLSEEGYSLRQIAAKVNKPVIDHTDFLKGVLIISVGSLKSFLA